MTYLFVSFVHVIFEELIQITQSTAAQQTFVEYAINET